MDDLFPPDLCKVTEKHTIPRILRKSEELNLYRKYYFPDFNKKFKCNAIESIDGFIFYFLSNDTFQYVLPFPIEYECYTFTLDKYNIMERNIINDEYVYRGYQIKWWFYKHPYYKYSNFRNYLNSISDDNVYSVHGKYENGKYVDCQIVLKYKRG